MFRAPSGPESGRRFFLGAESRRRRPPNPIAPVKAFEILEQASPDLGRQMLRFFREHERDVYRTTLASLAGQRRLRPVFIQKKPVEQQIDWILSNLNRRQGDAVAEHLLQVWLMKGHSAMLVDFLDAAGIAHDGEGGVDDLPETLDAGRVASAVDALEAKYPAELVSVYLRVFQLQQPGGWPEIAEILANRPALALGEGAGSAGGNAPGVPASEPASPPSGGAPESGDASP